MQKSRRLGRGVAVVGAGMSKFGMFRDRDSKDLFTEAYKEMLASVDKGVDPMEIDARIEGVDTNRPENIKIGMPLAVKFLHRGEKESLKTYLAFEAL